jgi:hypothetical protein
MALSTYDISADQGSDLDTLITYTNDVGTLINLTGCSARMQVRQFAGSSKPVLNLTSSSGITLGGAAGTIRILISAAALSLVPAGSYAYDIELVDTAQVVLKIISGQFVVNAEVTR